jgi:ABC-type amino acid transport substrate-binding protein
MDDERIERALRQGPPDEPAYVPGMGGRLESGRRVSPEAEAPSTMHRPDGSPDLLVLRPGDVRLRRAGPTTRRSLPVTIAAALAIVVGGFFLSRMVVTGPGTSPAPSLDLLGRLHAAGSVGIAVSNGAPQTVSAGGAYIGFDVDTAKAIAEELGLDGRVSAVASNDFARTDWDLALPGGTPTGLSGAGASEPYAYWPIWLAAGSASPVTDLASLASARVCVVEGSTGAAWLGGEASGDRTPAPAVASVMEATGDDECVTAVTEGSADAMVTKTLLAEELASRGLRLVVPTPVATEPWSAFVQPGADAATLRDAVNRAISNLRTTGRLGDMSRSSFGGQDVSVRQP